MASRLGRNVQIVIDRLRGKARTVDEMAGFSRSARETRASVRPEGELERLYYSHNGRIVTKWHHYLGFYEPFFESLRDRRVDGVRILELGVSNGGSLQLWRSYFGAAAHIVGIDIDPDCRDRVDGGSAVLIGDQTDPAILDDAIARLGGLDIVIDDGSHLARHQIPSFEYLYPKLANDGIYICEDMLYSYLENHDGGLRRSGTFVEYTKELIDRLNAWFLPEPYASEFAEFAQATYALHITAGVVLIEKRNVPRPIFTAVGMKRRHA